MSYDVFHSVSILHPEKAPGEIAILAEAICFELGQTDYDDQAILSAERLEACMTDCLCGGSGADVIVIAGIFRGWEIEQGFAVSKELSRRLRGTICHTAINLAVNGEMRTQVFQNGFETYECVPIWPNFWPGPKVAPPPS